MIDTRKYSIERLIRLALYNQLITDYRMTSKVVELDQDNVTLMLDPEEARLFLRDLVGTATHISARSRALAVSFFVG